MAGYVRVVAQVDEDAVATVVVEAAPLRPRYDVRVKLKYGTRDGYKKTIPDAVQFAYPGHEADGVQEVLTSLKKGKNVELVAELTPAGDALQAKFLRLNQMDFGLTGDPVNLLPDPPL